MTPRGAQPTREVEQEGRGQAPKWTCPETVDSQDEKIVFSKGRFTWA